MPQDVFDETVARTYDADSAPVFDPAVLGPTVDLLADLAGGGAALELAIGTGRVALPLAARGVPVSGIEISTAMLDRLRAQPGGAELPVVVGDMATARVPGAFRLVYLVYNTITNLLTQEEQVACFANAAAHLEPGGRFLIEVGVPDLQRLPPGESARPFSLDEQHLGFDTYDLVGQGLVSHHYVLDGDRARTFHSRHRYVWPAECDLMARLAGLHLEHRWADWRRSPFTAESRSHVSVWRRG